MLIDWFTVSAQALNFLALVWLLKRYLYKPVLAAIGAREQQIARAVADAAALRHAADGERAALAAKEAALQADRAALLQQAADAASAERERLLADARAEAQTWRSKQIDMMHEEQSRLNEDIARLATREILEIVRTILEAMAGTSLEEMMVLLLERRLRELTESAKQSIADALSSASEMRVRTAFELPAATQARLCDIVQRELARAASVRFETSAELVCGVELAAGGYKVAWTVREYLERLEQKIAALNSAERAA